MALPVCDVEVDRFLGRIAIGRLEAGTIQANDKLVALDPDGSRKSRANVQTFSFAGMGRTESDTLVAGDVVAVAGLEKVEHSILERQRELRAVVRLGVPVVRWRGPGRLDAFLRDVARRSTAPRMARR